MKKVISLLLALIMIFTTASAYSNDNDNISVAHAQVYHASGVNEYGTNILEKSEIEHDVPAKIITQNGCINNHFAPQSLLPGICPTASRKAISGCACSVR